MLVAGAADAVHSEPCQDSRKNLVFPLSTKMRPDISALKTQKLRRKSAASINNSRWAAYVTTGAATALSGVDSAEADIHYSGTINQFFAVDAGAATFALDQTRRPSIRRCAR